MKRNRTRLLQWLSILLAIAMLLSTASCRSEPVDTSQSTSSTTANAPPAEQKFFVPTGEYTIVYSETDGSSEDLSRAISLLSSAMSTVYGIYPLRDEDYYKPSQGLVPNAYEILIGATNRPQSQAAYADLGVNDYLYYAESEQVIVICGGSIAATVRAIEAFCESVLGYVDDTTSEQKKTPIEIGARVCHRDSYTGTAVTLNGVPLSEWTISINTSAADLADRIVTELGAPTGERIPTVLRRNLTGEEKNLIVIGADGRTHTAIEGLSGFSYRYEVDGTGMVLSLAEGGGYLEQLAKHLFGSMTKTTENGTTAFTLSEEEYRYYAIEELIDPWIPVSETRTELHGGVTYVEQTYRDEIGLPYHTYALLLDPNKVKFHTGTANDGYDYAPEEKDRQTTLDHMQAAVAGGENIIAAINTNFFNINTNYAPIGLVIKDGVKISPATAYGFFAVTEEGEVIIDKGDNYPSYEKNGVKLDMAVSGSVILLSNGRLTDKASTKDVHPRSLIGIAEDGTVIIGVIDGRQPTHSNGASLARCALWMQSLGAKTVLNLDGGGSSNLILRDPSDNAYTVCNSPSDGSLRKLHTSLLVELK